MIILSIDSSTPVAGIAVSDGMQLLGEITLNTKNTHSEKLMPLVKHLLDELALSVNDLDAIAVTQGPGSFTGLRIGMATAKGLAQGAGKKLIAVPTLDCLAQNLLHYPGIICPIMNAQKKQVYTAIYRSGRDKLERLSDYQAIAVEQLAAQLKELKEDIWFVGDGVAAFADMFQELLGDACRFADGHNILPRAGALAMLAAERASEERFDDLYQAELIYIRKSEAEVQWEARQQNQNS
ncbi:MAG: tRNA (adenosine(37)-N6)-threonylcarbamoyltransferase complex dimerization subunit type 1 TsaB [Peptococcaceae bacterium]|nr:tRNA (adenosine(37)-N6)-threonylcarbamoyltransferase complex dimerization subunit type 1 TsaB [Peptococcaceae bacterium]MBQ2035076.1 tRNA (adenosine(37)-N6)-threonylcarbamoyltransferase complex dimerization subunit type 1 TsaB [Peptococcaceae bacterium]MBQ2120306.1 tRNA (adenosine(37)-N6)-threonylcarbamoyltransferase complex dimerization subunit type 1 TsaB [Peptococcaceae bacterium]MBQ2448648.1 tRNA (adenosine(37)-N6)-threonylcarbamoyltransferase complex dimerization subunit type 1 TsaB [Pep